MGLQIVLLICIGVTMVPVVTGSVWEFGSDNNPSAEILSEIHGKFSLIGKTQDIYLDVPPCRVITYVKVLSNNYVSTPKVYYDQYNHVVRIQYGLLQFHPSTFIIITKGAVRPGCDPSPGIAQGPPKQRAPQDPTIQQVPQGPPIQQASQDPTIQQVPQNQAIQQDSQDPTIRQVSQDQAIQQVPQGPPINQVPIDVRLKQFPEILSELRFTEDMLLQPTWTSHKLEHRYGDHDTQLYQDLQNAQYTISAQDSQNTEYTISAQDEQNFLRQLNKINLMNKILAQRSGHRLI
nr:BMP-2-inducible protein kinase-like isoform X9 [Helicoverpa armigera]